MVVKGHNRIARLRGQNLPNRCMFLRPIIFHFVLHAPVLWSACPRAAPCFAGCPPSWHRITPTMLFPTSLLRHALFPLLSTAITNLPAFYYELSSPRETTNTFLSRNCLAASPRVIWFPRLKRREEFRAYFYLTPSSSLLFFDT